MKCFPIISCLKCTVNSYFHLFRRKSLPTNDFELTVPAIATCYFLSCLREVFFVSQGILYVDNFMELCSIVLSRNKMLVLCTRIFYVIKYDVIEKLLYEDREDRVTEEVYKKLIKMREGQPDSQQGQVKVGVKVLYAAVRISPYSDVNLKVMKAQGHLEVKIRKFRVRNIPFSRCRNLSTLQELQ